MKLLVTDESVRLARWLRLLGHDAALMPARPLPELYRQAYHESRVVVTRNRDVKAGRVLRVVQLASEQLDAQLSQVVRELKLPIGAEEVFSRCDRCNVAVEPAEKAAVKDQVPPYVFQTQQAFHRCPSCRRIYWAATHWDRARRVVDRLREEVRHG